VHQLECKHLALVIQVNCKSSSTFSLRIWSTRLENSKETNLSKARKKQEKCSLGEMFVVRGFISVLRCIDGTK
jgi:hypothetical protein